MTGPVGSSIATQFTNQRTFRRQQDVDVAAMSALVGHLSLVGQRSCGTHASKVLRQQAQIGFVVFKVCGMPSGCHPSWGHVGFTD